MKFYLQEKLTSIHSWSNMARFTRSGGEANAVAVRIARAATSKKILQFVDIMDGMIGIFQQTQSKNNLNNHLMKNLPIDGVPKELKDSIFVFEYNNYESLKRL